MLQSKVAKSERHFLQGQAHFCVISIHTISFSSDELNFAIIQIRPDLKTTYIIINTDPFRMLTGVIRYPS